MTVRRRSDAWKKALLVLLCTMLLWTPCTSSRFNQPAAGALPLPARTYLSAQRQHTVLQKVVARNMLRQLQSASRLTVPRQARCSSIVVRVSSTGPLPTEAAAVSRYLSTSGEGLSPCLQLLKQAAADKSVQPELVEGALAYLEQNHSRPSADISGSWRLVFSTATSSRIMQYIPVQEDFVIQMDQQLCALESVLGPFRFNIRGKVTGWNAATGAMDFQFTAVDILLFDKQIWQVTPKTKPKTYTFYYEADGIAAARSSAGGLALLRK